MTNRLDNMTTTERLAARENEISINPNNTKMKITPNYLKSLELGDATLSINRSAVLFNAAAAKLLALDLKSGFSIINNSDSKVPNIEFQDEVPSVAGECFTITGNFAKGGCQASAKGLFKLLFDDAQDKKKVFVIGELKNGKRSLKPVRK
jgi:hypothetical protein